MFLIIGGRGYHEIRVRTILQSWARCVRHVLVFTDPSVNLSGYASEGRFVYVSAGDAWRRRPFLPLTHMEALGRLINRPGSPAANVAWYFLVTDRTFVDVRALLSIMHTLDPNLKGYGYYGHTANSSHKEAFGFHAYVDLNTGVLLSTSLLGKIADPAQCHDQKYAGGTFDMFDAKLGNCIYFLKEDADSAQGTGAATPINLPRFRYSSAPASCIPGGGVGGIVSYGQVEPSMMAHLSACARLLSAPAAAAVAQAAHASEHPELSDEQVAVHVMARETKLQGVIDDCEATWARPFRRVYYHADRSVAQQSHPISRGRYGVSRNFAKPTATAPGTSSKGRSDNSSDGDDRFRQDDRRHRIAALMLPERPDSGGEHWKISHDKGMGWNTWLRFKMKAIFEWSVRAHWSELRDVRWHVYVDDDTYVLKEPLMQLLRRYSSDTPHYFGRPLQEEGYPGFVGGGAGIVMSRAAAQSLLSLQDSGECDPLNLKWVDRIHQGGDAWLGDCAEAAGVSVDMEYGFYPQPPVANLFHLYSDAVCFHGVEDHREFHRELEAFASSDASNQQTGRRTDPRCTPVFVNHKYTCLPHFIIGGVPKAGTTSLYKYLLQHPEVVPAKDKELTFWGNFFSPKRRPGREEVMTKYLDKFPLVSPNDFKVTGEATPGYLYCLTCPTYILKYIPRIRLLFTLRNPVTRAYSEYLNKRVDRTVMRYLHKRINNKMDKELSDKAPPFARLVEDVARTMESCGEPNRTYSMMDEYTEEMERDRCYVNPFVGEGRYARYLKQWLEVYPPSQILLLNFDEWTDAPAHSMERVRTFLDLAPFTFELDKAHNTHLSRSVHVQQDGASNRSSIAEQSVEAGISYSTHCILHEFFAPFQDDLDTLLSGHSLPRMAWETARKGARSCPSAHKHWPSLLARVVQRMPPLRRAALEAS